MFTKNRPGKFDCYANALPDEPMFVLLARDPSAPGLVLSWAEARKAEIRNGYRPASDHIMVEEARQCAEKMRIWRVCNDGIWRK